MAKAKRQAARTELRRNCGAMAAHMMLLEKYPAFRSNQMRLEGATARRREMKYDPKTAKLITIKTVVHVVYKTDEQNISDAQIKSQITALNKDYRATNPDRSKVPAPWKGLVTDARIQFKLIKVTRTKTSARGLLARRRGQEGRHRRHRADHAEDAPEHLGVPAQRRAARLRAVSGRTGRDRRRGDQLPGVRHQRDGAGAVQQGAHGHARSGTLPEPAPHLGRHPGLQRLGHGGRHAQLRRTELRRADLSGDHLRQRPERRHVRQLHGLHRRRGDVHVDHAAGRCACGRRWRPSARASSSEPVVDPSAIYGIRWVHVFEEDTAEGQVYKPESGPIPLSRRPREALTLHAGRLGVGRGGRRRRPPVLAPRRLALDRGRTGRGRAGGRRQGLYRTAHPPASPDRLVVAPSRG